MWGFLSKIAAALQGDATDVLDIQVSQVSPRLISLIRSSHPFFETLITIGLPLFILATAIYQHFVKVVELTSSVKGAYSHFLCSITVQGSHELNKQVCAYLAKNGIGQTSRSLTIADASTLKDGSGLKYLPGATTAAWFKFNGHWIKFTRGAKAPDKDSLYGMRRAPEPDVTLFCFALTGNIKPIQDFLDHLQAAEKAQSRTTIEIRRFDPGNEIRPDVHRRARTLDSVAMDAAKKHEMITDMTEYLDDEAWYAERGIPWRRGYLLYGPPGTGKTSIATAIAGHFNIPLTIVDLSLPGMNDETLQTAFDTLPRKCVVLLEDLDSAGIGREGAVAKPSPAAEVPDINMGSSSSSSSFMGVRFGGRKPQSTGITLSGLLNAIDGPASHEGRILVCTTNSPDSLDAALLRPGRIDMKILFGNASAEVTESLFTHIFDDTTATTTTTTGERTPHDVAQMARKFAALIPEDQVTPAEIQNFLLRHRRDPTRVLDGAEAWVRDLLVVKRQGGNVASFKGQI